MLPQALEQKGAVARLSAITGLIASLAQLLGLLRWVMVVPFLAGRWVEYPEQRQVLEVVYEVQHRLFGVMLGEHVGQLFMGVWTALVSVMVLRAHGPKPIAVAGFASTLLFLGGLGGHLSRVVPMPSFLAHLPMVAFIAWSLWAIATGVLVARRSSIVHAVKGNS
jgi:hypothetical protein